MNVSEILLFCSSSSPACVPCFQFIQKSSWLSGQIQIVRLDTVEQRQQATSGNKFQIRVVPTLVAIYEDGDTSVYQGTKKVLSWLYMRIQSVEAEEVLEEESAQIGSQALLNTNLYSGTKTVTGTSEQPQTEESLESDAHSSLDINAKRKREAEGSSMGELVNAARKMEQNRQTHLSSAEDKVPILPMPVRTFN